MSREAKLKQLAEKRQEIFLGGGEKKIEEQHQDGKMTARERIMALLDEGSFVELDQFVTHRGTDLGMDQVKAPGEGVVTGYGTMDGRLVYLYSQDHTVIGGSLGEMHARKICKVMDMALKTGAPLIGITDSGGVRLQEGIDALNGYGKIYKRHALISGVVPQIAVVLGPCAGGAVYSPALADFVFMADKAQMFITGPQLIQTAGGASISGEELGGAATQSSTAGNVHFYAQDEAECMGQIRRLMSFLPANNLEGIPVFECNDPAERMDAVLADIVPEDDSQPFDMHDIIVALADNHDFFEIQADFAKNMLIGFIRLNGMTVGVVANQPMVLDGALDMDAADKAARFVRFCDSMGIPLLTLVDSIGNLPSAEQEHKGAIRHGAKLLYAYAESTVPKITLIVRKAYGYAYLAMGSQALGADVAIAWPSAEIAVMSAPAAAGIVYREEIEASAEPQATQDEKIAEYQEQFVNPYFAASRGLIDMIIEPEQTRFYLIKSLDSLICKKESRPGKKHDNLPL
ncbi:MAG: acyl-CoA carboxylase subunit beta [Firmicutes bacterium]|nr:acyl-CoA carboxylase subunit beta [Bacillota bacterium]